MFDGRTLVGIILQRARRISVGNLLRDDPCAQLIDLGSRKFHHNLRRGIRSPQCPQRAASMRWTSFSVIGLDGDSGKKRGPAEYDRVAKHTRPPQRQGDLRRVIVVDVRDGGERNKLNVSLPIS